MAKILVVLAPESEVEDFYEQFDADEIKRNMGWSFAFNMCDPDTERPSQKICREIVQLSGLPSEIIGDFSHLFGEFLSYTRRDSENYDLPKDFTVAICSDDAEIDKLKVYASLKGFDVMISELSATVDRLKEIHKILSDYFDGHVTVSDVCLKLGW
jgi:hypothetical protein